MNPELSIIDSITKVPHSIDDVIWLNCKNYKENCYLPQVLPFDGPAVMKFITETITGSTFKIDLGITDPESMDFEASGTIINVAIMSVIKDLDEEIREELAKKDQLNHPANTPFAYILNEIPKKQLDFRYSFTHQGDCITFLEYMPHLLGLASILSNIILNQGNYYQGNLDLAFFHNYSHSKKKEWTELVNKLKETRVNNDWDFKYPRLLVNKNVKAGQFYTTHDFSLLK